MNTVWSQSRLATGLALAIWAVLFWYILLAERTSFYFASRTSWLVPVGAITLTVAMLGRVISSRVAHAEPVSPKQFGALVVLIAPAVLIMAFPPATLGSFAVSRRSSATIKGAYVSATDRELSRGDLSLVDIFGLSYYGELDKLAPRAGTTSSFTGFVTRSPTDGANEFQLNRFMISCCPGDAVSVNIRIVGAPSGQFEQDDWVRVTGKIYPIGKEVIVDALKVEPVPRPQRPYLNSG
jgi:uncharacterized repeat protein (TIGR03943 family)